MKSESANHFAKLSERNKIKAATRIKRATTRVIDHKHLPVQKKKFANVECTSCDIEKPLAHVSIAINSTP